MAYVDVVARGLLTKNINKDVIICAKEFQESENVFASQSAKARWKCLNTEVMQMVGTHSG